MRSAELLGLAGQELRRAFRLLHARLEVFAQVQRDELVGDARRQLRRRLS